MKKAATAVACGVVVAASSSSAVSTTTATTTTTTTQAARPSSAHHPTRTSHVVLTPTSTAKTLMLLRGGSQHSHEEEESGGDEHHSKKSSKKKKKKKSSPSKPASSSTSDSSSNINNDGDQQPKTTPKKKKTPKKHHTHQSKVVNEILGAEDYYDVLGVSKSSTSVQIQKAYRRRAVQTHPDKMESSDRRAFDKVSEAYDVLSDDNKRKLYDRYGKAGVSAAQGGTAGASAFGGAFSGLPEEILRSFFGVQTGDRQKAAAPRNRTVRYQLEVSLEDLYKGMTRTVFVSQQQPGWGYWQQREQPTDRKKVEVHVPRGMASGQSIVLSGEMDSVKDATPADLVFLLAQRPHPVFTRKGHDLAMEITISLKESLCGMTERTITHLDGRNILISSAKKRQRHGSSDEQDNEFVLIQTGDVHVLKGEGMPKSHGGGGGQHDDDESRDYGDLYIQYKVEMPSANEVHNNLSTKERQELGHLLEKLQKGQLTNKEKKKKEDPASNNNVDVRCLERASPTDFGRASGPFRMERDDTEPHLEQDEDHDPRFQFPFGSRGPFHYFSSAGFRDSNEDDDHNGQCQQM